MRSFLLVLGVSSVTAFKPATKNELKGAVNTCLGSTYSPAGDCCASVDGSISKANGQPCPAGHTHLSDWDTSLITDMDGIFEKKYSFDQDVGNWDVSSVTTIWDMFWSATEFTNKGQPLYWDVRNVKYAAAVFGKTKFNQCLCNWDTSNIQDMRNMFYQNTEFNRDVSCWDMSAVYATTDYNGGIGNMFNGATGMAGKTLNFDLNQIHSDTRWNHLVSGLTADTSHTFSACTVPPLGGGSSGATPSTPAKVACATHQDQSSCCAQYGCSFSNSDCIDTSALYGNTDQCTVPCAENEHVVDHVCTACPAGKSKPAGDRPGTNSECWDAGSCGGVLCVDSNTESCTNDACVCKTGFGGSACDKDITVAGLQKMLEDSRKKALPSRNDLIQRQKAIKDFARDTLKQKIKQGKSVKDAIKETKVAIEPSDLPQRSQMIVQLLNKAPVVAVAPANRYEEDTCAQGADTAGCSMVDLSDDADEITILSTDPEPGSWSVLSSGGAITSKQTRVSEFEYEMQCWDNGWGEKETLDVSDGAQLYACNGNVIMIASQSGICTPTTCNNGNCTIDGTSYTCSCEAGWSGDHCDEVATNSQCYEFDCSNYGGHKTLEHCGGSCSASVCCNYATKAEFNAVCDGLSSAADYVTNKCCHRDICI
jgi:hypothetical protein